MNNTQEFIYKGYFEGLNKHDRGMHILKKQKSNEPYYLFKLDKEVKTGDRIFINYHDIMPYKKGQLILGGCEEL
jgi:hypothetical protein